MSPVPSNKLLLFSGSFLEIFLFSLTIFWRLFSSTNELDVSNNAMGSFTLIFSTPSFTRIFFKVPSSELSNSIIALSVSISASKSPAFILSPSLTNHFDNLPSDIVGESAGINISVDISLINLCR